MQDTDIQTRRISRKEQGRLKSYSADTPSHQKRQGLSSNWTNKHSKHKKEAHEGRYKNQKNNKQRCNEVYQLQRKHTKSKSFTAMDVDKRQHPNNKRRSQGQTNNYNTNAQMHRRRPAKSSKWKMIKIKMGGRFVGLSGTAMVGKNSKTSMSACGTTDIETRRITTEEEEWLNDYSAYAGNHQKRQDWWRCDKRQCSKQKRQSRR